MRLKRLLFFLAIVLFSQYSLPQSATKLKKILQRNPDRDIEVITCDKRWEYRLDYPAILDVGDKYVMYYRAIQYNGEPWIATCYAESKDGITWEKPDLGLFSYKGNKHNNIITDRYGGVGAEYVDGTFYLLADRYYDDNNEIVRGVKLLKSTDGIHFSDVEGFSVPFFCDTQNQILLDEYRHSFNWYFRSWYWSDDSTRTFNHSKLCRAVSYYHSKSPVIQITPDETPLKISGATEPPSISKELPIIIDNNTSEDYDIYSPCVHQYRRHLFIAYPTLYYHVPNIRNGGKKDNDGKGVIAMYVSHNGKKFRKLSDKYMTNADNWMEFAIGHIETDEMIIHYYVPFNNSHAGEHQKNSIRARIHLK